MIYDYIDELIAGVLVVGCLILIGLGIDTEVKSILSLGAGWCFGSHYQRRRKKSG